jgi:hypothetical protein
VKEKGEIMRNIVIYSLTCADVANCLSLVTYVMVYANAHLIFLWILQHER